MRIFDRLAAGAVVLWTLVDCASPSHLPDSARSDGGSDLQGQSSGSGGGTGSSGGGSSGSDASEVVDGETATTEAATIMRSADPCIAANSCAPGTWVDVTPTSVNLTSGSCGNYGTKAVQVDPIRAEDIYVQYNCDGIWKSTDYGQTWTGPINTGTNGTTVSDCAGAIAIARDPSNPLAILYQACIRGSGVGFWKSTNGGVDWTNYSVLPSGGQATAVNQQFYAPAVDPYDASHLLMAAHESDLLVQSTDGGKTWTSVTLASAMVTGDGGTAGINFVNTGSAATTRTTWLWTAAGIGVDAKGVGTVGTWRTADGGSTWKNVDETEHTNGSMHSEVFQALPYSSGVIYMAGEYSALGAGVVRSADFGQTWTHVGLNAQEAVVVGSPLHVYSMYGWGAGVGQTVSPALEVGPTTATGTWTSPGTPAAMTQGPGQAAVTNDGTYNIILMANYNAGVWRYVEPTN